MPLIIWKTCIDSQAMPSEATQITAFNCCRVMPRRWVSASNSDVSGCPLDLPMANWNLGSPNYSHCSSFINAGPWCRVKASFQDAPTGGKMELPIRFAQGYYLIWPDKGRSAPQQPKDAAYIPLSLITRLCSKSSKAPHAGICKDQFTWKSLPLIQKNM